MSKQTMGKDDNGVFHPGKGRPSGANKEEGLGLQPTDPEKMDDYIETTEKYTVGADELDPSVTVRHPNRNTTKGETNFKPNNNSGGGNRSANYRSSVVPQGNGEGVTTIEQLPGTLTRERFTELANYKGDKCISIYLKTHPSGTAVNEQHDIVNFKNQLQNLNKRLSEEGMDGNEIQQLLAPGYELLQNNNFWTTQTPGLAVFLSHDYCKYIKMPVAPATEELVIEPTFYITPLVQVITREEYFYILVISKQCAKMFKADYWGIQPVPLDLPQSIEEVKRLSSLDATTFRSGETGSRGPTYSQEGSYHGIGGGNPNDKDNALVYFEAVDDELWDQLLNKENAPLLLAGVEYILPIYRNASDYKHIWPEVLTGNRERQEMTTLYADAMEVMKPYFDQRQNKALENYGNNTGSGLSTDKVEEIIPAAYYAKIDTLFVCKGEHLFGTFDEMANQLQMHTTSDEGGEDLIDNAVEKTIANGGSVFLLDKTQMPSGAAIAAIMRY